MIFDGFPYLLFSLKTCQGLYFYRKKASEHPKPQNPKPVSNWQGEANRGIKGFRRKWKLLQGLYSGSTFLV